MNTLQNEFIVYTFIMCANNNNAKSSALFKKIKNYKKMFFNENVEKLSFHEM